MAQFKNQHAAEARLSWRVVNVADDIAEIDLFDRIGDPWDGVTGADFVKALREAGDASKIILNISSPGGYVSDARLMYNALLQHEAHVEARVIEASSAASFVAMAADEILIAQTGKFMIHEAHGFVLGGNASEMRAVAAELDAESNNIASIYANRTGTPVEDWRSAMQANDGLGTSYRGQEAVDAKLADGMMPEKKMPKRMAALALNEAEPAEIDLSAIKQSAVRQPPAPTLESLLGKHSLKEAVTAGTARGGKQ